MWSFYHCCAAGLTSQGQNNGQFWFPPVKLSVVLDPYQLRSLWYYRGTGWYGWRCTAKSLWFLLLPWEVVKFCTVKLFCYDITIYYLFIYLLLETSVENISYCNLWIEEGDERSWESINLLPRISIPCPGTDEIRNAF